MVTRAALARLTRRLDAHLPSASADGRCTCPVGGFEIIWAPDSRPDPGPCPTCGGWVKVIALGWPEDDDRQTELERRTTRLLGMMQDAADALDADVAAP